jgi:hypothetical protein
MGKFVLVYTGGTMEQTPEAQQQAMAAWGAWFGQLGEAVVDAGAPFGGSETVGGGSSGLTGYSIIAAADLSAAVDLAGGCPVLAAGGGVEVYETVPVEM